MNFLELGGRQHGLGVALEGLELVGEAELLEQPADALGAGFLQPGSLVRGVHTHMHIYGMNEYQ